MKLRSGRIVVGNHKGNNNPTSSQHRQVAVAPSERLERPPKDRELDEMKNNLNIIIVPLIIDQLESKSSFSPEDITKQLITELDSQEFINSLSNPDNTDLILTKDMRVSLVEEVRNAVLDAIKYYKPGQKE